MLDEQQAAIVSMDRKPVMLDTKQQAESNRESGSNSEYEAGASNVE